MVDNILKSSLNYVNLESMPPGKKKTLNAAIMLFSKQGYKGTSTLEIAEIAGVSQATVFKYFKTKQELLGAIVSPIIPELFLNFFVKLKNIETTKELIHFIVRDRFEFIKENKDTIKIILSELLTNEQFKENILSNINNILKDNEVEDLFRIIFKEKDYINKDLTFPEILRSIIGPISIYFIQRFIIFDDINSENEEYDLSLIEKQIYNNLTI